jgi:hypothetical protein
VSKRHQSNRRKTYGRRQHELRQRGERPGFDDAVEVELGGDDLGTLRPFAMGLGQGRGYADLGTHSQLASGE